MNTQIIKLTEKEIEEQVKAVAKYKALVEKELSYGHLVNLDNVNTYAKAMKYHAQLAQNGCIEMPII